MDGKSKATSNMAIKVAKEMSKRLTLYIKPEMVTKLNSSGTNMEIYAVQSNDATVLAWRRTDGKFIIKIVSW